MFPMKRYVTARIADEVPVTLQLFMWACIDMLEVEADYLQVFDLTATSEGQRIAHIQEQPEYRKKYLMKCDKPLSAKIFVIDDGEYATMLFTKDY